MTATVTFYFDPVSPYAWLSTAALDRIEAAGAEIVFQPVLFAGLLNAHGQKGPAEVPAKRQYLFRDVMREAARLGLGFKGPPGHPFNPLQALRMCLALTRQDQRRRFALAVMKACWEDGKDVSNGEVLMRIADEFGLDGAALRDAAQQPHIKAQLASDTEKAIACGVFGVPTFGVDGELFWGGDRVDALVRHLQGERIDEQALADFLAKPPLAERRR
ncbi:2-hydroxychromene-2-carboxylate isomerase [Massilia sp. R2A-15]|uniref:2-hydroxychromene-2-carboxylate isomerase n=1 Tax=Massilia sp. R2A-15 TaxID=3064278 RepID=UPI002733CC62|nr:2-hydroxychromene-2-carboxylate isomerase [Massilia sp. R2A-15]WLI91067.1 2-hydroxychromene-2-carboxylate isomerase [Massilia sp. R2A-15]